MSKLVGSPTTPLVDAAKGKMDVVISAVESLRDLARQPHKPPNDKGPAGRGGTDSAAREQGSSPP
jgi:hypothetical protein